MGAECMRVRVDGNDAEMRVRVDVARKGGVKGREGGERTGEGVDG